MAVESTSIKDVLTKNFEHVDDVKWFNVQTFEKKNFAEKVPQYSFNTFLYFQDINIYILKSTISTFDGDI